MVTTSFKLPESLLERAKRAAKARGPKIAFADIVREALEMQLDQIEKKKKTKNQ
jgi:predicted DNA-binding protein